MKRKSNKNRIVRFYVSFNGGRYRITVTRKDGTERKYPVKDMSIVHHAIAWMSNMPEEFGVYVHTYIYPIITISVK